MKRTVVTLLRLFVVLSVTACTNGQPGAFVGEQSLSLKAAGLSLTANPLDAPPGALSEAQNAVIRRPGVVEPRRGQKPDATVPASAYADAMAVFESALILHTSDNTIAKRVSDTTVTPYSGTFTPPTGYPMRFAEAGGGLYATTGTGLVRLDSPTGTPIAAGVPPGLEGSATTAGTTGWLALASTVGYRLVWGTRDDDGAVLLGAPSGRILITNLLQNSTAITFTWTRAAAVITATKVAHGLSTGNTITVNATGDSAAVPLGSYVITVTGVDTFTFTGVDAGAASSASGNTYVVGGGTRDVAITTPIPSGIVARSSFLQAYRTVITATTGTGDPGEDMAQVGEFFPTAAEIAAGVMTVTDGASFANGASAYFGPNTGAGLADAKDEPPVLKDAIQFKGYLFGAVIANQQTLELSLLGIGGTYGLTTFDGLKITQDGTSVIFLCNGIVADEGTFGAGGWIFTRTDTGTAAQNIEATARSLVRVINLRSTVVTAIYASGPNDLPGKIILYERAQGGTAITVQAFRNAAAWTPKLLLELTAVPTRAAGVVTMDTFAASATVHRLSTGDKIIVTVGQANFPAGTKTITSTPTTTTFTYAEAGANVVGAAMTFTTDTADVEMLQEAVPGSWAHSAFEEPDAWPPRFHYQVGGPNTRLDRITAQGEALLFWTSEGLYRLTGDDEDSFVLRPMDPTVKLIGGKTPVNMGNKVYALTDQGVVAVSELGVEKISGPLDVPLLPYYASTSELKTLTESAAFGVGYESENEYILFLPALDAAEGEPASLAYVYNSQTRTWVGPWVFNFAGINTGGEVHTGVVGPDNRLYLAAGSRLTRERKDRALTDQQDADGVGISYDVAYQVQTAQNPAALKQWVEVTELLEKPQPASVALYFTTEISAAEEGGTLTSKGNAAVRTYIPRNKSRSARLTVGLRHSTPLEKATLLGLSVVYNVSSTRVGR